MSHAPALSVGMNFKLADAFLLWCFYKFGISSKVDRLGLLFVLMSIVGVSSTIFYLNFEPPSSVYYASFSKINYSVEASIYNLYFIFICLTFGWFAYTKKIVTDMRTLQIYHFRLLLLVLCYCAYSFLAARLGMPDIIPNFLDNRNDTPWLGNKVNGFMNEAGHLVVPLTFFPVLLVQQTKGVFFYMCLILFIFVISVSLSTKSIILILLLFTVMFIHRKFFTLSLFILGLTLIVYLLNALYPFVIKKIIYVLFIKIQQYLQGHDQFILGSAEYRSFTTAIGFDTWMNFPLGVGTGYSGAVVPAFIEQGIQFGADTPKIGMKPNNAYVHLLVELGTIGFIIFIVIVSVFLSTVRKSNSLNTAWLISFIAYFVLLTGFQPYYSSWFYLPLLLYWRAIKDERVRLH